MSLTRRAAMIALGATSLGLPAAAMAADDEQQLYAAAKKEGRLTWYSGVLNQPIVESIGKAFTTKYPGISFNGTKTTSQVAFQRVMQDINGGAVQSDIFTTTDASHMTYLISKDKLVKYTPPGDSAMVPALREFNGGGFYHVTWVGLVAIMYNKKKVSDAESPKDWPDLTDPKWKNKIAFGSPNFSRPGRRVDRRHDREIRLGLLREASKLNPLIGRSIDDAVALLNSGERQVAICDAASAYRSIKAGNPSA